MKVLRIIASVLIYLLGAFFILMSFDVFVEGASVLEMIGGFLIHASPGIVIILVNYFLRKQYLIIGIIYLAASVFFFILFKFYKEIADKLLTIFTVMTPSVFSGVVFTLLGVKKLKNKSNLN